MIEYKTELDILETDEFLDFYCENEYNLTTMQKRSIKLILQKKYKWIKIVSARIENRLIGIATLFFDNNLDLEFHTLVRSEYRYLGISQYIMNHILVKEKGLSFGLLQSSLNSKLNNAMSLYSHICSIQNMDGSLFK